MKIEKIEEFLVGDRKIFVKIYTDERLFGVGEASPLTFFSGETQKSILTVLRENLVPMLIGENPLNIEALVSRMDSLPGWPSAKAALDMALYDLKGKHLDTTVCDIIGGRFRNKIEQTIAIGLTPLGASPKMVANEAVKWIEKGFNHMLKIKIGPYYHLDPKKDYERVKAVFDATGGEIPFWVDAQASYNPKQAIKTIKQIERLSPSYFESPTPRLDIDGMTEVRRSIDTPVMADEAIFSPFDAIKIVKKRAADVLAIKFVKCGGIHNAKRIAAIATAAGLSIVMISPGESSIGLAANVHVAASSKCCNIPCNIHFEKSEDWLSGLELDEDNNIVVPTGPGLGIKLLKQLPQTNMEPRRLPS